MASTGVMPRGCGPSEDILDCLPATATKSYGKAEIIYGPEQPSTGIYMVAEGHIVLSRVADEGSELLLEIMGPDEIFGESALAGNRCGEQATVLGNATLMVWPISTLEELMIKRPGLAVALLQVAARRAAEFAGRIESLSVDSIERRLARALLRFSERLGSPTSDGGVAMIPLTHAMLSRHIGTSRALITHYMGGFRRQGYLNYSHDGIVLRREGLEHWAKAVLGRRLAQAAIS